MKKIKAKKLRLKKISVSNLNGLIAGNITLPTEETNQDTCPSFTCAQTETCANCPPNTVSNTTIDRPATQNYTCIPICPG